MTTFKGNFGDYKIISILGECSEGKAAVHLAKHIPSSTMVALKRFYMDKMTNAEQTYSVELEIATAKQLQHPNILQYHTNFVHGFDVYVVSPLMAYCSCRDLLNQHFNNGLPQQAILIILRDLLCALAYMHRNGYIHRAIKASHVLVSETGKSCLTGFKYSCLRVLKGKWQNNVHSFLSDPKPVLNWTSPELLEQNLQGYNDQSDMYSVGMFICELANGSEPFLGMACTLMLTEKLRGCVPQLLDCTTVPRQTEGDCVISPIIVNRRFSKDLHEVTGLCLSRNPNHRPKAGKLLNHSLFKSIKKRTLSLNELLKPALPLSDKVAFNREDVENLDVNHFSNLALCTWDF
ncbi:unnamed protein product [Ceutorhynchus assimilis]|uniref:Protein kinase domain-containing protein n=1 Tax=Ceutorhynchus assimilis TaxID=467358 RepID=A0A9N9QPR3_9CUCU|nr:unnamed protein product [Ceutorhynchus assimilis]